MSDIETQASEVESRADALLERFAQESVDAAKSEPEDVETEATEDPEKPAPAAKLAPAEPPAPPKDESLDRIARLERENLQRKQEIAQRDREARERDTKLTERESRIASLEKRFEDPDELLSYIEEKGWEDKLSQHILKMADPAKRAEAAAKKAAKTATSETEKRLAALEAENQRLKHEQANAEGERLFSSRLNEVASEAPFSARALARAPERTMKRAHAIAASFGNVAFNLDDVIIQLERDLAEEARIFRDDEPQQSGSSSTTSKEQQTQPDAAAKATTVSNRAAAARTTIVEDDGGGMSFDERIARAERRMRKSA